MRSGTEYFARMHRNKANKYGNRSSLSVEWLSMHLQGVSHQRAFVDKGTGAEFAHLQMFAGMRALVRRQRIQSPVRSRTLVAFVVVLADVLKEI